MKRSQSKRECIIDLNDSDLLERLAELEHNQWMFWINYLVEHYPDLPQRLKDKWFVNLYHYQDLSEEMKEKDRVWAKKVLKVISDWWWKQH